MRHHCCVSQFTSIPFTLRFSSSFFWFSCFSFSPALHREKQRRSSLRKREAGPLELRGAKKKEGHKKEILKNTRIPVKFVMEFGDELSDVATLTVPNGHLWQVGLEKGNKEIWFDDGWQDFMEHHSIHYGYFLVFRYEGNSKFHVLVFDYTATEIQYPRSKNCKLEDEVDKLKENVMSNSDKLFPKHEVDGGTYVRERFSGTSSKGRLMMSRGRGRAIKAARLLKPKSPWFMAILRPYHIRGTLYVPVGFASKYLCGHPFVKLETCDGKQWRGRCCEHRGGSSKSGKTVGWGQFCRENKLEEGDVCVFELIKRKPVVLKVSIFHSVDYAVN